MGDALLLAESARRFGHYAWLEQRLFEVLGRWAGDTEDRAARPVFAAHAAHHAWRAGVWRDRLPRARGFPGEHLVVPANDELVAAVDTVAAPGPTETLERLVGEYRVLLPHLELTYRQHLARLTPISDGPTIRLVRQIAADVLGDVEAGNRLLVRRLATPGAAERAEDHRARLAELVEKAGGIAG